MKREEKKRVKREGEEHKKRSRGVTERRGEENNRRKRLWKL